MMVPVANRILIDLGPLRESRGFRLLFAGQFVEVFASQLTAVAIPFQVYSLTRSSLQVGLVSLAQLVPLIIGALTGGSLGDAFDRRLILVVTSVLLALTSGGLAVNAAAPHPSLAALYLVSAAAAGLAGMASTASNAAVPSLVAPRHLVAAYSATQAVDQVGLVIGPALAGLLIEAVHLPWVYAATAVIYLLTAVAAARLPAIPPAPEAGRPGSPPSWKACVTCAGGRPCRAPTSSTSTPWCSACRGRCSRPWPSRCSTAGPAPSATCTPRPPRAPWSARSPPAGWPGSTGRPGP